ncbi:MAG TPA: DNA polymerase III subunit gamma/tau [Candidatus Saccharimonadales bacterium]|nr:DNA polymerase III subunit gamma/tau [Candidatus Saccharimonadales bacterium]
MGQALYRKHRPKALNEVVGQEHITKTLSQALKQGRISHAYLLTGPRGVGKTSIARILAHEINGLPYDDDSVHIDIIEIDAASNRRIDEIRELREKVYVAPAQAKYKVYIIDEVHMLTREAFNALLKTLEEPPEHAVFILATTDAHKLPETIISRTQRYSFKPVDKDAVADHLADIAKQEKINISPEALELLAEHGEGSFRDSISMLDQVSGQGSAVELADVQRQLGLPPAEAIDQLLESLASGSQASMLMQALGQLYDQGYPPAAIAKQLGQTLRSQLAAGDLKLERQPALALLSRLINVPSSPEPASLLEIILLSGLPAEAPPPAPQPGSKKLEEEPAAKTEPKPTPKAKKNETAIKSKSNLPLNEDLWPQVLTALKQKHNTLYGVARMAQPRLVEGSLRLTFAFAFHQKRFNEANNRQLLLDTITDLTGQTINIDCVVDSSAEATPSDKPAAKKPAAISAISNIFGGGELLES